MPANGTYKEAYRALKLFDQIPSLFNRETAIVPSIDCVHAPPERVLAEKIESTGPR